MSEIPQPASGAGLTAIRSTLERAVADGATVVCVSVALARALQEQAAALPARTGAGVWRTPDILAWPVWMNRLYLALLDAGACDARLLDRAEEDVLWQQVITDSVHGKSLLAHQGAARAAAEAARVCTRFDISTEALKQSRAVETRIFADWREGFVARVHALSVLAPDDLDDFIAGRLHALGEGLPHTVLLAGFDQVNPAGQRVLAALADTGVKLGQIMAAEPGPARVHRFEARDARDETALIRQWVLGRARDSAERPRLGIAAADKRALREQVHGALSDALRAYPGVYEDTLAERLAEEPCVHDGLALLRACLTPTTSAELCALLRSPAIAHDDAGWMSHTLLEADLAATPMPPAPLAIWLERWPAGLDDATQALQDALHRTAAALPADADGRAPSAWSECFAQALASAGWPGAFMNAARFEEALREQLDRLAGLDRVMPTCSAARALEALTSLATEAPPAARQGARVRLLDLDEAANSQLDGLWIALATDDYWPRSPTPAPLLPVALQLEHGVPDVTAAQVAERDEALTERLLGAAPEVIVSHALQDGDRELRLSPLFARLPAGQRTRLELQDDGDTDPIAHAYRQAAARAVELEALADCYGPNLPAQTHVRGGTRLLADQSDCPFRAFAVHRLHISTADESVLGLDRRDAGSLLHRALELTWTELGNSARLHTLTDDALRALCEQASVRAVNEQRRAVAALHNEGLARLEARRLAKLLLAWLEVERQRPYGFQVLAQERGEVATLGPLSLDIRMDRVDRLDDGTLAVIDYKSGDANPARWFEARMGEPQVPLYAVTREEPVSGALFAQLRVGDMRFRGVVGDEAQKPDKRRSVTVAESEADWAGTLAGWRTQLIALATEFADGCATVTPARAQSCQYCDIAPACRIDASFPVEDDDEVQA